MKRKGLLLITGCGEKRFESYANRNQLPFPSPEGKWNDYTLEDAFELRLMMSILDNTGADIDFALYMIGNGLLDLTLHPLNYSRNWGGDMWIGAGVVKTTEPELPHFRIHAGGRLQDLVTSATSKFSPDNGAVLESFLSVNVSEAADHVRKEAMEIGLPEGRDFSPIREHGSFPDWMQPELQAAAELLAEGDEA